MPMRPRSACTLLIFVAGAAVSRSVQAQAPRPGSPAAPSFSTETSLVVVPALVRTRAGDLVYTLKAEDFRLTDEGVPQQVLLDHESGAEPLALVVLVEVGGAGARAFQNYDTIAPPLAPMLASLAGSAAHRVAVVTFDSHPSLLQKFTSDIDEAATALRSLAPGCTRQEHYMNCTGPNAQHNVLLGDNGAAIFDSLAYSVELLRSQPIGYRRAILLVSETLDRGSETSLEQAVRAINDTNTTIYSIAFSTAHSETVHYAYRQLPTQPGRAFLENHHPNPPHGCMGKDPDPDPDGTHNKWVQFYDCVAQLAPPLTFAKMAAIAAADALQRNAPETVARMTGGEYFRFSNLKNMEQDLATIGNHLPNRYVLSFRPPDPHPGLHTLVLHLPGYDHMMVQARTAYWVDPAQPHPGQPFLP